MLAESFSRERTRQMEERGYRGMADKGIDNNR
jgi:hypothetical protein